MKNFWSWFEKNEARLFEFEREQEKVFAELNTELSKIHKDLTFEFGPEKKGKREFVISAGGIKGAFPSVIALANTAPSLPRWEVIRFRPRRREILMVKFQNLEIAPEDVQFSAVPDGEKGGIILFMKGYSDGDRRFGHVGFLFLDQALGEYDVETKVGFIEFKDESAVLKIKGEYVDKKPLADLAKIFDEMFQKHQKN